MTEQNYRSRMVGNEGGHSEASKTDSLVQSSSKQFRKWKTTMTSAWREMSAIYIWKKIQNKHPISTWRMLSFPDVSSEEFHLWTYCEQHKVLLVVLPNTVIDPGTMVVHFPYATFANTAGGWSEGQKGTFEPKYFWMYPKTAGTQINIKSNEASEPL